MKKARRILHDKFTIEMKKITDMPNNGREDIDRKIQLMRELHRQFLIDDKPYTLDDVKPE